MRLSIKYYLLFTCVLFGCHSSTDRYKVTDIPLDTTRSIEFMRGKHPIAKRGPADILSDTTKPANTPRLDSIKQKGLQ